MVKLGNYIQSGNIGLQMPIEWVEVNSLKGNFLISANILDIQQFHHERAIVDFDQSTLKQWLNKVLFENFSDCERLRIKDIGIPTADIMLGAKIKLNDRTPYVCSLNKVNGNNFFWIDDGSKSDMQTIVSMDGDVYTALSVCVESFVGVRIMLELKIEEEHNAEVVGGALTIDSIIEQRKIFNNLFAKDFVECCREIEQITSKNLSVIPNNIAGKRILAQQELADFTEQQMKLFEEKIMSIIMNLEGKDVDTIIRRLKKDLLELVRKYVKEIKNIDEKYWQVHITRTKISYQDKIKTFFSKILKKIRS